MTGQRIIRPSTAFSVARSTQKKPRITDDAHLKWIRTLRCCLCGAPGPDPAHIRSANALYGKRETGGGEKPSDKWVVPLCRSHHDEQHAFCDVIDLINSSHPATAELRWWASKGLDPFGLALALHHATGDDDIADGILHSHRKPQVQP